MAKDFTYKNISFNLSEIDHYYGDNVHITQSPLMLSFLAKLGSPETKQPLVHDLINILYSNLFDQVVDSLFPKKIESIETRMKASYEGLVIDSGVSSVVVDLARAGTVPSQLCYNKLNLLLNPDKVRQDHFYIQRVANEKGEIVGVNVSGSKVGGDVDGSIVMFPDPMGATGSTIVEVYNYYKNKVGGKPLMMISLHLIVTPEFLKKVTTLCPDLHIFSLRIDRGLSDEQVLKEIPGKYWEKEVGLNEYQYIIPGAGGLGEILNNSYC